MYVVKSSGPGESGECGGRVVHVVVEWYSFVCRRALTVKGPARAAAIRKVVMCHWEEHVLVQV
jgi:hypothetical protein